MTITYLRGGLSACSVVWLSVQYLLPKVCKICGATVQKRLLKASKSTAYTFLSRSRYAYAPLIGGAHLLRLSATLSFGLIMTISIIFSSIFSDLTSQIITPFGKPQDSLPVGSIVYLFQLLEFCALH